MKKILIALQFIIFSQFSFSQITTWKLLINTENDRLIIDMLVSENQMVYLTGLEKIPDSYHESGFILKLNKNGELTDSSFYSNPDSSIFVNNIIPDTATGFIISMLSVSKTSIRNNCGFQLKRIDTNLNTISNSKHFHFPPEYNALWLNTQYGIENNIMILGYIFPVNTPKMFIYKLNLSFDSLQAKIYLNDGAILPAYLKQLPNYSYWLIRKLHSNYVLVDSSLNLISSEQGTIPRSISVRYGLKWDSDSSFYLAGDYVVGFSNRLNNYERDIGFFHQFYPFDTTGVIFNKQGAIDTNDFPAIKGALDYKNKDSIFIGGSKNLQIADPYFAQGPSWFSLIQTDSMLNIRWERFYGGDAYYNMTKLIATKDGGCIMAGTRFDYKAHPWVRERDIYIVKVNAEGLLTGTGKHADKFVHDAIVYPNPGSNAIQVRVAAQHPRSVFRLYDINGKLVMEHGINGKTARFNTTFLKAGTYVYSITGKNGLNESGKWVKK